MRRIAWPTVLALAAALTVCAGHAGAEPAGAHPHAKHRVLHVLRAGHVLRPGEVLVSPHGRYRAQLHRGRLIVSRGAGHWTFATPKAGRGAVVRLTRTGQLRLTAGHRPRWSAGTRGAGSRVALRVSDRGVLALTGHGGAVWTSVWRDACPRRRGALVLVDISRQLARACDGGQQLRVTPVTTGASAIGDGTPTGTWTVQAKIRDTTLYPASGGAYPVKYWVPYDGAYGMHDASWQKFRYGSARYKRHGSHGCVHVPLPMMAWLFHWVRVGATTVTVHR